MFTQKTLAAAAAIALLPAGAFAGEFSASAGFEASIDFDDSLTATGDAVELTLGGEYAEGGFSAALDLTFAETGGTGDEVETELSLAYAGDISDKVGYEVSVTSNWLNDSGYDTTEAELAFSFALAEGIDGSYAYTYDLETEADYHEAAIEFALGDWSAETVLGLDPATDVVAWELNFGYEFENGIEMGIEFSDDDAPGTDLGASLIFGYSWDLI
ncbi:hypothetical protein [Thalassovita sp.]|jgi:hypothetical protein|uniref:hypothetical protein n=1 Tax=Thalassovita sp. TaxID=1979401 RepID=UPI003B5BAD12